MNNFVYVPREKAITIILKREEDGLHLTYANEYFCHLISTSFPYDKNEPISTYMNEEYYNSLEYICGRLETEFESFQSNVSFPYKNKLIPMYIQITLLKQNGFNSFFITANDVDKEDFYNTFLVGNEVTDLLIKYNSLLKKPNNAVATFNCEDPSHPKIEHINAHMLELIVQTSIFKEPYFYERKLFNKLQQTKATIEDNIIIHKNNSVILYKVLLIPIIDDNDMISKIIIKIMENDEPTITNSGKSAQLTRRENEVIEYVLLGAKNDYIARKLNITIGTVKRTIFNVYNKLGISSRVELLNYYHFLKNGKESQ